MNNVTLMGRLTRDAEVRYTDGGMSIARFSLAVDRRFAKEGQQTADFINCIAFGKTAEFIEKYFNKGSRMCLSGRIQTGSYEKDGQKIYTTDIVADQVEFCESKGSNQTTPAVNNKLDADGFMSVPDGIDEELPFN